MITEKIRSISVFFSLIIRGDASEVDDAELIRTFLEGERRSFDWIVMRYKDMVFNLCYSIMNDYDEADECAQETFIKIYKNLGSFKFRSAFSTWIYSITVNTCRNRLTSAYKRRTVPAGHYEGMDCSDKRNDTPERLFEKNEIELMVRKAIDCLPEEERIPVILRDLENRSYEDISEITGVRIGTVKSRIARGRHRLRGFLKEEMP